MRFLGHASKGLRVFQSVWIIHSSACVDACPMNDTTKRLTLGITYHKNCNQNFYLNPPQIDYRLDYFYFYATYGPGNETIIMVIKLVPIISFFYIAASLDQYDFSNDAIQTPAACVLSLFQENMAEHQRHQRYFIKKAKRK